MCKVHVQSYDGGRGGCRKKDFFSFIFHFIFSRPYARLTHYMLLLRQDMLLEIVVHRSNDV